LKKKRSREDKIKTIHELESPTNCIKSLFMAGMKKNDIKVKSWSEKIDVNIINLKEKGVEEYLLK
jgi:hypothetical protein